VKYLPTVPRLTEPAATAARDRCSQCCCAEGLCGTQFRRTARRMADTGRSVQPCILLLRCLWQYAGRPGGQASCTTGWWLAATGAHARPSRGFGPTRCSVYSSSQRCCGEHPRRPNAASFLMSVRFVSSAAAARVGVACRARNAARAATRGSTSTARTSAQSVWRLSRAVARPSARRASRARTRRRRAQRWSRRVASAPRAARTRGSLANAVRWTDGHAADGHAASGHAASGHAGHAASGHAADGHRGGRARGLGSIRGSVDDRGAR
jgi:hypothetical protein